MAVNNERPVLQGGRIKKAGEHCSLTSTILICVRVPTHTQHLKKMKP